MSRTTKPAAAVAAARRKAAVRAAGEFSGVVERVIESYIAARDSELRWRQLLDASGRAAGDGERGRPAGRPH